MESLLGLEGKSALVAGGGQGIGRATALLLARAGCGVAVLDEVVERAAAVVEEVRALGVASEPLVGDVTRAADADRVVGEAEAGMGGVDALVNIIGSASWAPLLELEEATWERDMRVNLAHHWLVARAAARRWVERGRGGTMVVVASVSGLSSAPRHGAYGAAKAGLIALVQTMAEEWWEHDIRVNAVVPGAVRTPRIEAMWESGESPRPAAASLARMCEPADIGSAALFLSSALARRITGQTVVVDAGVTTRFPFQVGQAQVG